MKIAIATDHNGFEKKEEIIRFLQSKKIDVTDITLSNDKNDDYPLYAFKVGELVSKKVVDAGILLCGSGIGMSIAANKVKGIRAAHVSSLDEARLSKEHNNANIIAMSAKTNNIDELKNMIESYLNAEFKYEERHVRRNNQIMKYELGEIDV